MAQYNVSRIIYVTDSPLLCVFLSDRHGAHTPGVRINTGHGEHDGSGGPLPAGAEHAGSPWPSGT